MFVSFVLSQTQRLQVTHCRLFDPLFSILEFAHMKMVAPFSTRNPDLNVLKTMYLDPSDPIQYCFEQLASNNYLILDSKKIRSFWSNFMFWSQKQLNFSSSLVKAPFTAGAVCLLGVGWNVDSTQQNPQFRKLKTLLFESESVKCDNARYMQNNQKTNQGRSEVILIYNKDFCIKKKRKAFIESIKIHWKIQSCTGAD